MVSANSSRAGIVNEMNHALRGARLLGVNDKGHICVWSGGYGFNVYDAAQNWSEISYFSSGELAGMTDHTTDTAYKMAKERMKMGGFEPIE